MPAIGIRSISLTRRRARRILEVWLISGGLFLLSLSGWKWRFNDPRCKGSYNELVLDDGSYVTIAPPSARAWHAGKCRSSDPDLLP